MAGYLKSAQSALHSASKHWYTTLPTSVSYVWAKRGGECSHCATQTTSGASYISGYGCPPCRSEKPPHID
eukprot:780260-Prorocentrum_lima.AAC.1